MYHAALRHPTRPHAQNPQFPAGQAACQELCNALICQGKDGFPTFLSGATALLSYRGSAGGPARAATIDRFRETIDDATEGGYRESHGKHFRQHAS